MRLVYIRVGLNNTCLLSTSYFVKSATAETLSTTFFSVLSIDACSGSGTGSSRGTLESSPGSGAGG